MKPKYIAYILGLVIGLTLVSFIHRQRTRSKESKLEENASLGFKIPATILPGEDLEARKPLHTYGALFTKETEPNSLNQFTRISVYSQDSSLVRAQETIWRHPRRQEELLIKRQWLSGNQFLIRLSSTAPSINLTELFSRLNLTYTLSSHNPRVLVVRLPSSSIEDYDQTIAELQARCDLNIEKVIPQYIHYSRLQAGGSNRQK